MKFPADSDELARRRMERDLEQGPPSPRPSPPRRGRNAVRRLAIHSALDFRQPGVNAVRLLCASICGQASCSCSLSLGERAGVRAGMVLMTPAAISALPLQTAGNQL